MFISALLHPKSLAFKHLTPHKLLVREGVTRIKAGKYTKKIRINKVFTLIFKHLHIVRSTQQMLAHQSLPTFSCEKPCSYALRVKRQVMHISTPSPRTTPCISLYWASCTAYYRTSPCATPPKKTTHAHLCMRFSSMYTPFHNVPKQRSYCTRSTFPHSEIHNTRVMHPYKTDIACSTLQPTHQHKRIHTSTNTPISGTTMAPTGWLDPPPSLSWHLTIFCLIRPLSRGTP